MLQIQVGPDLPRQTGVAPVEEEMPIQEVLPIKDPATALIPEGIRE